MAIAPIPFLPAVLSEAGGATAERERALEGSRAGKRPSVCHPAKVHHDPVDMRVVLQGLAAGMEDGSHAELPPRCLGSSATVASVSAAAEQDGIDGDFFLEGDVAGGELAMNCGTWWSSASRSARDCARAISRVERSPIADDSSRLGVWLIVN